MDLEEYIRYRLEDKPLWGVPMLFGMLLVASACLQVWYGLESFRVCGLTAVIGISLLLFGAVLAKMDSKEGSDYASN